MTARDVLRRVLRAPVPTSHAANAATLAAKLEAAVALYDHDEEISNEDIQIVAEIAQSAQQPDLQVRASVLLLDWKIENELPVPRDPATFGGPTTSAPGGRP